jgi:eukaryotic-like serine/threonine-protein kinase
VGDPVYKPDPHQNAILDVLINGRSVKRGAKVSKGSIITLVVGDKLSSQEITVPYLIGLRYEEAIVKLREEYNLNVGAPIVNDDVTDTLRAFVWKQEPSHGQGNTIRLGEEIDLFLAKQMPQDIEIHPELYNKVDTIK